jgi:hypothetical protein
LTGSAADHGAYVRQPTEFAAAQSAVRCKRWLDSTPDKRTDKFSDVIIPDEKRLEQLSPSFRVQPPVQLEQLDSAPHLPGPTHMRIDTRERLVVVENAKGSIGMNDGSNRPVDNRVKISGWTVPSSRDCRTLLAAQMDLVIPRCPHRVRECDVAALSARRPTMMALLPQLENASPP